MQKRFLTPLRKLLIGVAATAVAVSLLAPPLATEAEASSTAAFNPGKIISNAAFYDGNAMSTNQIKSFLKKQIPNPTSQSLAKYSSKTKNKKADAYCKAYKGTAPGKKESAAKIIYKVGKACGISQKALLVILQKETSLVGLRSPEKWRYDRAMGYACPDTGPNRTANCDTSYYGFFNQVYNGARQLKRYGTAPYTWLPVGKTLKLQYHPQPSCGTQNVKIENKATAALYYYTPYVPNKAILNGKPNSCSSHGNLNFHRLYRAWFGSTDPYKVNGTIKKYYDSKGGAAVFGESIAKKVTTKKNGGGVYQRFEKGLITYSKSLKKTVFLPNGKTLNGYLNKGGPNGDWGWPKAAVKSSSSANTDIGSFQRGRSVRHAATPIKFVPNKIMHIWDAQGGGAGKLGYPLSHGIVVNSNSQYQRFDNGTVMFASGKKIVLSTNEAAKWRAAGGQAKLGLATANASAVKDQGSYLRTQKGALFLKNGRAAQFVPNGKVLTDYLKAGGPAKRGWPKTALNCKLSGGGCKLTLDAQTIVQSKKTGSSFVNQNHYKYWVGHGSKRFTTFGYPVKSTKTMATGTLQRYQKAIVAINENGKVTRLDAGPILNAYVKSGWFKSSWGMPVSVSGNKQTVRFDNGVARYRNGKVTFTKNSAPAASSQQAPQADMAPKSSIAPLAEEPSDTPEAPDATESPETPLPETDAAIEEEEQ